MECSNFAKLAPSIDGCKVCVIFMRGQIQSRLARLEFGHFGDTKALGNNVYGLRVACGPGYRVYFTKKGRTLIILLYGGDKTSQPSDIKKALKLAKIAGVSP